jgi:hypothetical protein
MGLRAPSPHHCHSTSRTGGCVGILFHPQPKRVRLSTIGLGADRSRGPRGKIVTLRQKTRVIADSRQSRSSTAVTFRAARVIRVIPASLRLDQDLAPGACPLGALFLICSSIEFCRLRTGPQCVNRVKKVLGSFQFISQPTPSLR